MDFEVKNLQNPCVSRLETRCLVLCREELERRRIQPRTTRSNIHMTREATQHERPRKCDHASSCLQLPVLLHPQLGHLWTSLARDYKKNGISWQYNIFTRFNIQHIIFISSIGGLSILGWHSLIFQNDVHKKTEQGPLNISKENVYKTF